jgi:flagellar hook assembly protein FlgD
MRQILLIGLITFLAGSLHAAALLPIQMSSRILTPNSIHNAVTFSVQNPSATVPDAQIFDIRGRRIVHISGETSAQLTWNGRDDTGKTVESGVYIIQITREDGSRWNGVVLVAR